jgi:hypothetical protein
MVVIVLLLDFQLHMQSVPITTNVASSNPITWRSVLLVAETVVPGENHRPAASH